MKCKIEFFRDGSVVRWFCGDFPDLRAAEYCGFSNTGAKDSPEEVDGFDIYVDGNPVARMTIDICTGRSPKAS
jgi:hypothetical protein